MGWTQNNPVGAEGIAILAGASRFTPIAAAKSNAAGVPTRRFVKDLIYAGQFVKAATGQRFEVTRERIDDWIEKFGRMRDEGVRVYMPSGHTNDPEKNRGYVEEMYREGDTLYGVCELIGEDALALQARAEVSIYVPTEIVSGKGVKFEQPIEHVAFVVDPVIPAQGKFLPIAAGRGSDQVPICRLSQEPVTMDWKTLAPKVGIDPAKHDDKTGPAAVESACEELTKKTATLAASLKTAESQAKQATDALAASRSKPEPDPVLVRMASENRSMKLDKLVADNRITAKVRESLADIYIGKDNAGLKLSLDAQGDGQFAAVVDALSHNVASELVAAQATKGQASAALNLGRNAPGAGEKMPTEDEIKALAEARAKEREKARTGKA